MDILLPLDEAQQQQEVQQQEVQQQPLVSESTSKNNRASESEQQIPQQSETKPVVVSELPTDDVIQAATVTQQATMTNGDERNESSQQSTGREVQTQQQLEDSNGVAINFPEENTLIGVASETVESGEKNVMSKDILQCSAVNTEAVTDGNESPVDGTKPIACEVNEATTSTETSTDQQL
jgi:hypothetical protein